MSLINYLLLLGRCPPQSYPIFFLWSVLLGSWLRRFLSFLVFLLTDIFMVHVCQFTTRTYFLFYFLLFSRGGSLLWQSLQKQRNMWKPFKWLQLLLHWKIQRTKLRRFDLLLLCLLLFRLFYLFYLFRKCLFCFFSSLLLVPFR